MKWLAVAIAALAFQGCLHDFENPHLGPRGLTEEDLNAPPGRVEIKSAIINDIRNRRSLRLMLDQGRRIPPPEIKLTTHGMEAVRAKDEYPLWRVIVWADPVERLNAVTETAYWDNDHFEYFYHYEGGSPHRDVWMGPFSIQFAKRPSTEHEH